MCVKLSHPLRWPLRISILIRHALWLTAKYLLEIYLAGLTSLVTKLKRAELYYP